MCEEDPYSLIFRQPTYDPVQRWQHQNGDQRFAEMLPGSQDWQHGGTPQGALHSQPGADALSPPEPVALQAAEALVRQLEHAACWSAAAVAAVPAGTAPAGTALLPLAPGAAAACPAAPHECTAWSLVLVLEHEAMPLSAPQSASSADRV